jgi:hypothetical protein
MRWSSRAIGGALAALASCAPAGAGPQGPVADTPARWESAPLPPLPPDSAPAPRDPAIRRAQVTVEQEVMPSANKLTELPTLVTPSGVVRGKPARTRPDDPPLLNRILGLDDTPIRVFGWIENSFTGNPSQPSNHMNFGVNPNFLANRWMGNQYYFVVENPLEPSDQVNFGFRVDNLFGNDWQFNHMQGLFDTSFKANHFAGYDPAQLYVNVHLPILAPGGLDIQGGRWYSIMGYESVPAINRPFLSVPYMFNYGQPFTFFGALTTLNLSDRLKLYNGAVNGWDRWIDRHDRWGYLGSISLTSKDQKTDLAFSVVEGPNQLPYLPDPNLPKPPTGVFTSSDVAGRRNPLYARSNRILFTTVLAYKWTKKLTQVVEADQAYESNVPGIGPGGRPKHAEWYGLANWFLYQVTEDDTLTLNWRSEVWRDDDGIRTFNPASNMSGGGARVGFADNFYEATVGSIYKPKPYIWIRPEARYDWSQFTHPYNGGQSKSQFTIAFDVIFLF